MPRKKLHQHALDAAVAHATGEDLATIRRLGFSTIDLKDDRFDPEPDLLPPQVIDWDEIALLRTHPIVDQPYRITRRVA